MANEGLEPDRGDAATRRAADGSGSEAPADDAAASGVPSDDAVEAVRAVILAAVDVGRQVLDVVERTLRDPATAEKLGELLAGLAGAAEGLLPMVEVRGSRARHGPPPVEHITIEDVLIEDGETS